MLRSLFVTNGMFFLAQQPFGKRRRRGAAQGKKNCHALDATRGQTQWTLSIEICTHAAARRNQSSPFIRHAHIALDPLCVAEAAISIAAAGSCSARAGTFCARISKSRVPFVACYWRLPPPQTRRREKCYVERSRRRSAAAPMLRLETEAILVILVL